MEIVLKEIKIITYMRNLFDFNPYLYFNTYAPKIRHIREKPSDMVVGLYRIRHGSDIIEEVFEANIINYSVLHDKVYYYFENQVKYYDFNSKEIHNDINHSSVGYSPEFKQTFLLDHDLSIECSKGLVYFDQTNFEYVAKIGHMNRNTSLNNKMMDCNNLCCYSFNGQLLWEVKVSEILGLSSEHFQWPKNGFQKWFCMDNYWLIHYSDNTILKLDENGTLGWSRFQWDYHTYHQADGRLYAYSEEHLSIIDPQTGEILLTNNIKIIKEKYNCQINRGGIWVYEDYVFLPSQERSIEWIVFNKLTLEEVGKMYIFHPDEDYFVKIPVDMGSAFYFIKNKVYIVDSSGANLRIFNVEYK